MGKLNMKLMQGIEETEHQIKIQKQDKMLQSVSEKAESGKMSESVQKPQIAFGQSKPRKNMKKSGKAENGTNTRSKKQVFSFRAKVSDIAIWKAYATAAGINTMEYLGSLALNEYIRQHKLTGAEKAVFEALKLRDAERE